jgi:ubiquinone/menaquinone biosynthesis C-methylase UbiE
MWLLYSRLGRFLANRFGRPRARRIAGWLHEVLPPGTSVLDVGCGLGHIAEVLRERGHQVTTVDPRYRPLCGGEHLVASATDAPVADRSYDVVLIAFTLHHMPAEAHRQALREAARIARLRVVLLEDTFRTRAERRWTFWIDSLLNAEWFGHPHSNRSTDEWLGQLTDQGLAGKLHWERRERWLGLPIRHALLAGEVSQRGS